MAGDSCEVTWNVDMEVNLFHAMRGHKPAGVNRHFQMISIHDRLSSAYKKMSSDDVWRHLSKLYDLQALNESEIIPFPNKNGHFDVLESDVSDLCEKNFPRTPYINTQSTETIKPDGSSKSTTKSVKQEPKTLWLTPKTEVKTESKPNANKTDNRANTPSNRGDYKSSSSSSSKPSHQPATPTSTTAPSPKRTKRTRNVPSAGASPATPTEPASKRRR